MMMVEALELGKWLAPGGDAARDSSGIQSSTRFLAVHTVLSESASPSVCSQ